MPYQSMMSSSANHRAGKPCCLIVDFLCKGSFGLTVEIVVSWLDELRSGLVFDIFGKNMKYSIHKYYLGNVADIHKGKICCVFVTCFLSFWSNFFYVQFYLFEIWVASIFSYITTDMAFVSIFTSTLAGCQNKRSCPAVYSRIVYFLGGCQNKKVLPGGIRANHGFEWRQRPHRLKGPAPYVCRHWLKTNKPKVSTLLDKNMSLVNLLTIAHFQYMIMYPGDLTIAWRHRCWVKSK